MAEIREKVWRRLERKCGEDKKENVSEMRKERLVRTKTRGRLMRKRNVAEMRTKQWRRCDEKRMKKREKKKRSGV